MVWWGNYFWRICVGILEKYRPGQCRVVSGRKTEWEPTECSPENIEKFVQLLIQYHQMFITDILEYKDKTRPTCDKNRVKRQGHSGHVGGIVKGGCRQHGRHDVQSKNTWILTIHTDLSSGIVIVNKRADSRLTDIRSFIEALLDDTPTLLHPVTWGQYRKSMMEATAESLWLTITLPLNARYWGWKKCTSMK